MKNTADVLTDGCNDGPGRRQRGKGEGDASLASEPVRVSRHRLQKSHV